MTAQDVAWLKREVFAGREVTRESADELFAVVRAEMDNAPEWKEFFVDMIAEHVVRQAEPPGVVGDERAAWLLARVDECKSVEALAALINVCAEAHRAPDWFVTAVKERAAVAGLRPRKRRFARLPDKSRPTRSPSVAGRRLADAGRARYRIAGGRR